MLSASSVAKAVIFVVAVCLLIAQDIQGQHNVALWRAGFSGSKFTVFNGTIVMPRNPSFSGTYYVWPGLQPQNGEGVLQEVADGRKGVWWIGNGWFGTPSLPWGGGFNANPGTVVSFSMVNVNNNWVSSLSTSTIEPVVNSFTLSHSMTVALLDVEVYRVGWDFGPVVYPVLTLVSTEKNGNICTKTPPHISGATAIYVESANLVKTNSGSTCTFTNVVMWNKWATSGDVLSTLPSSLYSLRLFTQSYRGPSIRVRRSSDNTVQDIPFLGDYTLDIPTLQSFVGSGTGYVVIWYDQSGRGNHAVQNNNAQQPIIVNAGQVIYLNNSRPAVFFDKTRSSYLSIPNYPFAGSSAASAYITSKTLTNNAWARYFDFGSNSSASFFATPYNSNGQSSVRLTTTGASAEQGPVGASIPENTSNLFQFNYNGKTMVTTYNGATLASNNVMIPPSSINGNQNFIGRSQYTSDPYYHGYIAELLFYTSDVSSHPAPQYSQFLTTTRSYYGV